MLAVEERSVATDFALFQQRFGLDGLEALHVLLRCWWKHYPVPENGEDDRPKHLL